MWHYSTLICSISSHLHKGDWSLLLNIRKSPSPPAWIGSLGEINIFKSNYLRLLLPLFVWCQESRTHVLRRLQDQADCYSWCYVCLMHIHNGLKIAQTLCNPARLAFFFFALSGISGTQSGIVQEIWATFLSPCVVVVVTYFCIVVKGQIL